MDVMHNTPKVTGSRIWNIVAALIAIVIVLVAIDTVSSYKVEVVNLQDGAPLSIEIPGGRSIRIEFAWNGIFPGFWFSAPIEIEDAGGKRFVGSGIRMVDEDGHDHALRVTTSYTFHNRGDSMIVVKAEKCADSSGKGIPCGSTFPPPTDLNGEVAKSTKGDFTSNMWGVLGCMMLIFMLAMATRDADEKIASEDAVKRRRGETISENTPESGFRPSHWALVVSMGAVAWFAYSFIDRLGARELGFWPAMFCGAWLLFIQAGGRNVPFGTMTGVFSRISSRRVGTLHAGSMNWVMPFFEYTSETPDVEDNTTATARKFVLEIDELPWCQTATRGIRAQVKGVDFILILKGDDSQLQEIVGGAGMIQKRIRKFVGDSVIRMIAKVEVRDLDSDKGTIIEGIATTLHHDVNEFGRSNGYPYTIIDQVMIRDIEIEATYYEAAGRVTRARFAGEASDIEAQMLQDRLMRIGKKLLPNGTDAEQLEAAQVSLGIVKKVVGEGIDIQGRHHV